jgi:hypothetical protein
MASRWPDASQRTAQSSSSLRRMSSPAPAPNSTLSGTTTAARPLVSRIVRTCCTKFSCLLLGAVQRDRNLLHLERHIGSHRDAPLRDRLSRVMSLYIEALREQKERAPPKRGPLADLAVSCGLPVDAQTAHLEAGVAGVRGADSEGVSRALARARSRHDWNRDGRRRSTGD